LLDLWGDRERRSISQAAITNPSFKNAAGEAQSTLTISRNGLVRSVSIEIIENTVPAVHCLSVHNYLGMNIVVVSIRVNIGNFCSVL
jgi:hypothetical protein